MLPCHVKLNIRESITIVRRIRNVLGKNICEIETKTNFS